MGEDVSSTTRTGITVILVAALIVAVLNLMVVAQNVMAQGLGTLEGGVDQISAQEFEKYNQKKVSGTSVKAAIALYSANDLGIVVETNASRGHATEKCFNYGTLLEGAVKSSTADVNGNYYHYMTSLPTQKAGESYFSGEYMVVNGLLQTNNNTAGTIRSGDNQVILDSSRFTAYLIRSNSGAVVGILFVQIK